jgi:hypothetical protein
VTSSGVPGDDAAVHLFTTAGQSATALSRTSFAALGLKERQHLQEWVIAHPSVMGDDLCGRGARA